MSCRWERPFAIVRSRTAEIAALTTSQFAALETADIVAMTTAQFRALTTAQIAYWCERGRNIVIAGGLDPANVAACR